ncbi:MAG: helix-turn-helix domain-containing protein [Betaproteobacteria bacterium]|nr:MAG: helix-turn-helix domain-containing protein [Betaproteobacteria bacterium]
MNIDIGSRLKQHRQQKGLSQRALARLAGVTNGLISQIEQNSISPSIASLKKILDVLSLSLADFFTGEANEALYYFYDRKRLPNLGSGDVRIFLVGAGIRHRAIHAARHEVRDELLERKRRGLEIGRRARVGQRQVERVARAQDVHECQAEQQRQKRCADEPSHRL